jgi:hypothetical protein
MRAWGGTDAKSNFHFILATDGKMSEIVRKPRLSLIVILAVSLAAIVLVASQKFGQSNDTSDSLLPLTGQSESSVTVKKPATDLVDGPSEPPSHSQLSLTGRDGQDNPQDPTSDADASISNAQKDQLPHPSDSETAGDQTAGRGDARSQANEETRQKDPMKTLSRQFARRRAARDGAKEAQHVTTTVPTVIHEPRVWLSEEHKKICVVGVGDTMPEMRLTRESESVSLKEELSDTCTVVVFWSVTNPFAVEQFTHLAADIVEPFAAAKLKAVAVHVGEPQDVYAELCSNCGENVTCLIDADKSNFAKIATRKLPRTYLLDAQGKIIWFDIEYSRSTRHELLNAVQYQLQGQKITPPDESASGGADDKSE